MTTEPTSARLAASGWRTWAELAAMTSGWRACWADLRGWNQANQLPAAAPWTSTVWAWTRDETTMMRMRLDPDLDGGDATVVASWLSTDTQISPPAGWTDLGNVAIEVHRGTVWSSPGSDSDSQASTSYGVRAWDAQSWHLYEVVGEMPVTLVRAATMPSAAGGTP
jgi:hypothetical protein